MNMLARLFVMFVILPLYDFTEWLNDIWQVRICRRHLRILSETELATLTDESSRRIAIFIVYPSDDSIPFTLHALRALQEQGFYTIAISTLRLTPKWREAINPLVGQIIERANVGRDFASYRMGLLRLGLLDGGLPKNCETLVLANDSMFYRRDFSTALAELLERQAPWSALFRCLDHHFHAQSFFTVYRRPVFDHAEFKKFWRNYKCFSSRVYTINKGEVGLSTAIRATGAAVETLYSSELISSLLQKYFRDMTEIGNILPLLPIGPVLTPHHPSSTGALREFVLNSALSDCGPIIQEALINEVRIRIVSLAEATNSTHSTGLLFQSMAGAPLKRDVCYRGIFSIEQVVENVVGFDDGELAAIRRDLERKGLPNTRGTWQRMLLSAGRI
jgi:hypothetical protein